MNLKVTPEAVLFAVGLAAGLWLLWQIKVLVLALFIAFILSSALSGPVEILERRGLPRFLSVALVYILMLGFFGLIGFLMIPPMIAQTQRLFLKLPDFIQTIVAIPGAQDFGQQLSTALLSRLTETSGDVIKITFGVFSNVVIAATVLVFTFYLLLERERLRRRFLGLFPKNHARVKNLWGLVEAKLGAWVRGQVALALIVGLASFVGLSLLRVDYALSLALIAGALEIFPIIGPIVAAVPALIVALAASPVLALGVVALYFLIQQLENNFVVPKVMQQAVGLDPLVTLLALSVGGQLMGVLGALLAVPLTAVLVIIAEDFSKK